ncbi:MAG: thioesterase family protein [Candidatus Rokuibacteriota bacterium]
MTAIAAPFDGFRAVVRPEWIDHNGHMNMGYYLVVFDLATDAFLAWVGLDDAHRRQRAVTTFCLEAHVTYHREVRAGDALRFTTLLLAHDAKRLHYFHAMYHADGGYLAATNELMSLHVSEATRRGAPLAADVVARLARIQQAHDALPRPLQVCRTIGLTSRPATR